VDGPEPHRVWVHRADPPREAQRGRRGEQRRRSGFGSAETASALGQRRRRAGGFRRVASRASRRAGGVAAERGQVGVEPGQFHRERVVGWRRPVRSSRQGRARRFRERRLRGGTLVRRGDRRMVFFFPARGLRRRSPAAPPGGSRGRLEGGSVRRRESSSSGRGGGAPARLRYPDVAGERHQGRAVPAAVSARAHRAAVRRAHAAAGGSDQGGEQPEPVQGLLQPVAHGELPDARARFSHGGGAHRDVRVRRRS
jgi:hypothetical protein